MHKSVDFWAGVVFAACGTVFLVAAQAYPMGSAQRIGPGYFPSLVAGLLILLGLFIAGKSFFTQSETVQRITLRSFTIIIAVLVFALLVRPLGMFLAAAATSLAASAASPRSKPWPSVALALGLAALVSVVFGWGLGVQIKILPF